MASSEAASSPGFRIEDSLADEAVKSAKVSDLASAYDIWALGIVIVIGGQYYGWNAALASGFGYYATAQILMGLAYLCYIFCVAEVVGAIAFSGGSYGLSRVVLGFYPGFIVGCMELIEYTVYTSVSVVFIGQLITDSLGCSPNFQPLIWVIFYAVSLSIWIRGGRFAWNFIIVLALVSLLPIVVYCLGSLPSTDFAKYATLRKSTRSSDSVNWFSNDFASAFIAILPLTTWAYGGIESLALVTSVTKDPKRSMPKGMISCMVTLFISSVTLLFIVSSMPPGLEVSAALPYPLNAGYLLMFNMSDAASTWLIFPAQVAMAFGFILPYGKLLQSLADSNLTPSFLGLRFQRSNNKAMILGSLLGFLFCVLAFLDPKVDAALQNVCILSATMTYFAQLIGFCLLRTRYSTVEREYRSPLGIPGAIFAGLFFLLLNISIIGGFQQDDGLAAFIVVVLIAIFSVFYFGFAQKSQTLSPEEHKSIFRFNVMNFNRRRNRLVRHIKSKWDISALISRIPSVHQAYARISSEIVHHSTSDIPLSPVQTLKADVSGNLNTAKDVNSRRSRGLDSTTTWESTYDPSVPVTNDIDFAIVKSITHIANSIKSNKTVFPVVATPAFTEPVATRSDRTVIDYEAQILDDSVRDFVAECE
jgi:amino acid transporter